MSTAGEDTPASIYEQNGQEKRNKKQVRLLPAENLGPKSIIFYNAPTALELSIMHGRVLNSLLCSNSPPCFRPNDQVAYIYIYIYVCEHCLEIGSFFLFVNF